MLLSPINFSGISLPPIREAKAILQKCVEILADDFQADEIWLYGSCAKGTIHNESDLDLMIVRESKKSKKPSLEALKLLRPYHNKMGIDLFVITPEIWKQRKIKPNGVYADILYRGKQLYAR